MTTNAPDNCKCDPAMVAQALNHAIDLLRDLAADDRHTLKLFAENPAKFNNPSDEDKAAYQSEIDRYCKEIDALESLLACHTTTKPEEE